MLVEQSSVPATALPVAQFRDHLLLGRGFSSDGAQDAVLENYLRAAIAAIEARTGKVLVEKQYTWTLTAWREPARQALPLAPVSAVGAVRLVDRLGQTSLADAALWRLQPDDHRPALVAAGTALPAIPAGGSAEIDFTAGYGPGWADVPADLGQAVMLLAAHYYENRSASAEAGELPYGVGVLVERYRNVRILGGGVR